MDRTAENVGRVGGTQADPAASPSWGGWVLALLAVVPAAAVLVATGRGPGISPDSVNYVAMARDLVATGGLRTFTGEELTVFPPGMPVILAALEVSPLGLDAGVRLMHAGAAAALVVLTQRLAISAGGSWYQALAATSIVALGLWTVEVHVMLWSEPLFSVLVTLVLVMLSRSVTRSRLTLASGLTIGLATSAATLLRYVGVTLIPIVALGALLALRGVPAARRLGAAAGITLLASAGLGVTAARNLSLGAGPLGDRVPGGLPPDEVVWDTLVALGEYSVTDRVPVVSVVAGIIVAGAILVAVWDTIRTRRVALAVVVAFLCIYWCTLWVSEISTTIDRVNARLMEPVFPAMAVVFVHGMSLALSRVEASWIPISQRRVLRAAVLLLLMIALAGGLARGARFAAVAARDGLGYNGVLSLESPLAAAVGGLPGGAGIASSEPYLTYWNTDRRPLSAVPRVDRWSPPELASQRAEALSSRISAGEVAYIALFHDQPEALSWDDLQRAGVRGSLVARVPDGELFSVRP